MATLLPMPKTARDDAPSADAGRKRPAPARWLRRLAEVLVGLPVLAVWYLLYRWSRDPP